MNRFCFYTCCKLFTMKKIKDKFIIGLIILGFCGVVYGIGYIKYNIWRAEHPQAKTWTFFVPRGK